MGSMGHHRSGLSCKIEMPMWVQGPPEQLPLITTRTRGPLLAYNSLWVFIMHFNITGTYMKHLILIVIMWETFTNYIEHLLRFWYDIAYEMV